MEFVRGAYFGYIIEAMKALGYVLLAKVEIRSDELRYGYRHEADAARSTRIFFRWPERALISQLNFTEVLGVGSKGYSYSVEGNLYANCYEHDTNFDDYCRWKQAQKDALAQEIGREAMEEFGWQNPDWPRLPYGIGRVVDSINGGDWTVNASFDRLLGGGGWKGKFLSELSTNEVARKAHELCEPTFLLLARKFDRLAVISFPPMHDFLGSERPFWGKFPFGRLREMVSGSIYGSDFPWLPEKRCPVTGLKLHPLYRGPYVRQ